jgi:hypothetical protein
MAASPKKPTSRAGWLEYGRLSNGMRVSRFKNCSHRAFITGSILARSSGVNRSYVQSYARVPRCITHMAGSSL